jgi:hypothetical protein
MVQRILRAVMRCTVRMIKRLLERGNGVLIMYDNPVEYPMPPVVKADLEDRLGKLANAQGQVREGGTHMKAIRDALAAEVFDMLQKNLHYTNILHEGDEVNLTLSGFPLSKNYERHGIPEQRVIKKIIKGDEPSSAKIILAKTTGPQNEKKERLNYYLWMSEAGVNEDQMRIILITQNQFKLIALNLVYRKEYIFAVSCSNAAGGAELSTKVKYLAH